MHLALEFMRANTQLVSPGITCYYRKLQLKDNKIAGKLSSLYQEKVLKMVRDGSSPYCRFKRKMIAI